MSHVVIFPTWQCQLRCAYCSIRHSKIDRTVKPVAWEKWAVALKANLAPGSVVDIAGGEPLLYDGIIDLVQALSTAGLNWAMTTNAKATPQIARLCAAKPAGWACINVSDHAGNPEVGPNVAALRRAGFLVNIHRVDHPAAGTHLDGAATITYQDWEGGAAVDGIRRRCTAGAGHWVADPSGDLWRCIVAMETGQPAVGNLFTGHVTPTGAECAFGCSTCYTEDPASWGIRMEAI